MSLQQYEHTVVISVPQELDHHMADKIKRELDPVLWRGGIHSLIFDFHKTTMMDSSGIGLLTGRYRILKSEQGTIYVTGLSEQLKRVFLISGLYAIVREIDDVEPIMKHVGGNYDNQ